MMVMEGQYWKGLSCQIELLSIIIIDHSLLEICSSVYFWYSILDLFFSHHFDWWVLVSLAGFLSLSWPPNMKCPSPQSLNCFSLRLLLSWISSSRSFKYLFKMTPNFMSSPILTSPLTSVYLTTWHLQLEVC